MHERLYRISCLLLALLATSAVALGETKTVKVRVHVDSEAPGYEGYRALDGNPDTMWHTRWQFEETAHPHGITVDLGASYKISGFAYLPRPGAGNGTIKDYVEAKLNIFKNQGTPRETQRGDDDPAPGPGSGAVRAPAGPVGGRGPALGFRCGVADPVRGRGLPRDKLHRAARVGGRG